MCVIRWHGTLIRRYIYTILLVLVFLLFLIRLKSLPPKRENDIIGIAVVESPPANFINKNVAGDKIVIRKIYPAVKIPYKGRDKQGEKLDRTPIEIQPKIKGNTISLTVYMESRCPDTTGFIKRQLGPTFEKLKPVGRVNYTIVPFGKAECTRNGDDFACECQHGPVECELNQLMNCVIDHRPVAEDFVPIIACVQGEADLDSALRNCIADNTEQQWLKTCTLSKRGRYLHALAGQRTAELGDTFNFVPWVVIDGKRVNDAFYALEENLCGRLDAPKPIQCGYFT